VPTGALVGTDNENGARRAEQRAIVVSRRGSQQLHGAEGQRCQGRKGHAQLVFEQQETLRGRPRDRCVAVVVAQVVHNEPKLVDQRIARKRSFQS
jgi:hypothetical protein